MSVNVSVCVVRCEVQIQILHSLASSGAIQPRCLFNFGAAGVHFQLFQRGIRLLLIV